MTTTTTPQLRFEAGAVGLRQRLVPVGEDLLAEQRAFYHAAAGELAGPPGDADIAELRAAWEAQVEPHDPTASHVTVDGVDVRVLAHPAPRAVVLHAHGGGWATGRNDMYDRWLGLVRDTAAVTVASVGYRRSPEHPYPAAIDDLAAVALRLGHGALGTERLVVLGESAGANLVAGLLVRLRRSHRAVLARVVGAALTYGCFEMTRALPSQRRADAATPVLDGLVLDRLPSLYAGTADPSHPEISPLFAELSGMPPALFTVGESDPLVDDSALMAHRWALAGSPATLDIYPEAVHIFDEFGTRLGRLARERIAGWIATTITEGDPR